MQKDAFKPQGREISVMGMSSPITGQGNIANRMVPMAQPPNPGRSQAPVAPAGRGGPIGDRSGAFKPLGAQVRLAGGGAPLLDGAAVDRGAAFQPSEATQVMPQQEPAAAPALAQAQQRPYLQRQQPAGETVFRVTMRGRTADGAEYASVYDAVMPLGAQPLDSSFVQLT